MTDIPLHRIASAFSNRPLLLAPEAGEQIAAFLAGRMRAGGGRGGNERSAESVQFFRARENPDGTMEAHSPRVSRFHGSTPIGADGRPLPYRRTENGVAIITIIGELVNRGAWIGASSGLVSYEAIRHQLRTAAADPMTRAIILDLESPGGEATGAFEVAAVVREAAAVKPVIALVDGMAASGGYAIASGATRIVTIPTGQVGSIGVLWVHYDFSAALEDEGVRPTIIFAGAHKVDGNPFEPLPDEVRAARQASVDAFYRQFLECVAKGRGARLTADAARKTEARVFVGAEAVKAGLADSVGTIESVLDELSGRRRPLGGGTSATTTGATTMNVPPKITSDLGVREPRATSDDDEHTAPPPAPVAIPLSTIATAVPPAAAACGLVAAARRQATATTGTAPQSADHRAEQSGSLIAAARRQAAADLASRAPARADASVPAPRLTLAEAARRQAGAAAKRPADQNLDLR